MTYFDTSVLVSLYANEPIHSPLAIAKVSQAALPIQVNPFQLHEVRTALRAQVFRGLISLPELARILSRLEEDIANGFYQQFLPDWDDVYREAESLSANYASSLGLRSSDILHVALALHQGATVFESFDSRQKSLADLVIVS